MERFFVRCQGQITECNEEDWCIQMSPFQLAKSTIGPDGDIVLEFINPGTKLVATELLALIALVWEEGEQEKEQIAPVPETVTCTNLDSN